MINFNSDNLDDQVELHEHYRIKIDRGQSIIRIDKFLSQRIEGVSRTKIQAASEAKCILVNGKPIRSNYKIKPNDEIVILLPKQVQEIEIVPQKIPLDVVYEDGDIIVVNKQHNLVVHPGYGNYSGTLQNGLLYHFRSQGDESSFPHLVHRIDKDTTGLLVVAKNEFAQLLLAKQFFEHSIEREYLALVWGDLKSDKGTITGNLARSTSNRKIMTVFDDNTIGKPSITHYEVIERFYYVTLVRCVLETGRTHQIRAHFKHIGHPLFGDELYGGNKILRGNTSSGYKQFVENTLSIISRQCLHAIKLGFLHPRIQQKCIFNSDLPMDIKHVIERWQKFTSNKKI